ncbi:hypothetical protein H257_18872 [Aphanomyces astaci]|uniref:Uncharacterized protein n=1 Tax=Aphanomyces astaci TaxID=112090 RepID=W4F9S8_APHAT|nr:hypothetical protein H257_18872 [Aphanomyces astaci]ETV64212.1 hypothetical protein H257_18872 [Aphanomyces astaci]|eukprot:XP_009846306.1 hypothetical protein H257_18872 [Aphanomyces astaci]
MNCCPPNSLPANPTASDATPIKAGNTDDFFYDNATTSTLVLVFPDIYGPDSGRTKNNWSNSAHVVEWFVARPFELLVAKIHNIVTHFQANHGVTTFGAVGSAEKTLPARDISHKLREFPLVSHGWVNRGDLTDADTSEAVDAAWHDEAVPFLQQHLATKNIP